MGHRFRLVLRILNNATVAILDKVHKYAICLFENSVAN